MAERETPERTHELRAMERDVAEDNPDDTTRREALELELMEAGRSAEGERVDLEDDLGPGRQTPG